MRADQAVADIGEGPVSAFRSVRWRCTISHRLTPSNLEGQRVRTV
jgi:hypothetical protein